MNKFVLLGALGLNLIGSGAGVFLAFQGTLGHKHPSTTNEMAQEELEKEQVQNPPGTELFVYSMDSMVVNLSGTPKRAVRIKVNIEMLDAEGFEEVMSVAPKSKDALLQILSGKTFDDLEGLQGKLQLKDQIATALNSSMSVGVVKDIYFSDFVMQ